jgi:hypothetical protein
MDQDALAGLLCLSVPLWVVLFFTFLLALRNALTSSKTTQKQRSKQRYLDAIIATSDVRDLSPQQFERYVGMLFEAFGCNVLHTGRSNDGGIDLIVNKNGKRGVVQCKQYAPDHKVGSPTVRDLRGAMVRESADLGFLVTTSTFTKNAVQESTYAPRIILFDAEKLNRLAIDLNIDQQYSRVSLHQPQQQIGCLRSFEIMFGGAIGWFAALSTLSVVVIVGITFLMLACCIAVALVGGGA